MIMGDNFWGFIDIRKIRKFYFLQFFFRKIPNLFQNNQTMAKLTQLYPLHHFRENQNTVMVIGLCFSHFNDDVIRLMMDNFEHMGMNSQVLWTYVSREYCVSKNILYTPLFLPLKVTRGLLSDFNNVSVTKVG